MCNVDIIEQRVRDVRRYGLEVRVTATQKVQSMK